MSNIVLVSEEKIKAFSSINENVSVEILLPAIQISQDIGLQTLLGTKFLDHIKNAVSGSTLTSAETLLLDEYIAPYLIHRGYWEVLPDIFMKARNKGLQIGLSEQSQAASVGEMRYMRSIQQNRFEFYQTRLMEYIKNNRGDYPKYFQYTSTDGMKPSKENYYGGLHVPPGNTRITLDGTTPINSECYDC